MSNPGRLRIKAAELLRLAGMDVSEYDIEPAQGYWRSSPYVDVYRWYVGVYSSWDTLTEFVRNGSKNGVIIDHEKKEIWAK